MEAEKALNVGAGAWTVRRSDGTMAQEPARQARQEMHRHQAVQIGHMIIRRLLPGETYADALETEAQNLAHRQGMSVLAARLVLAVHQDPDRNDPESTLVRLATGEDSILAEARAVLLRPLQRDFHDRRAHEARLREHQRQIRLAHGLRNTDPTSAVALPRYAKLPKLVAHGRGAAFCGAAACGGLSVAAVRLANGSDLALAVQRNASDQLDRGEARAQAILG